MAGRGRAAPRLRRALAAALLALPAAPASALSEELFGNPQALQLQPELDLDHHLGEHFRAVLKLQPVFIPSESYAESNVGVWLAWLVHPIVREFLHPDRAKGRALDLRVGASFSATVEPGTVGWSREADLALEATARFVLPLHVLAASRNRFEARWQLADGASFSYRLRTRLQLERDFELSARSRTLLTPYANVELLWSSAQSMWSQFRVQAGLQLAFFWFGSGQVVELNASAITYLQPSRSYAPVVGLVLTQYL